TWFAMQRAESGWHVQSLAGAPSIGDGTLAGSAGLAADAWIRTDDRSKVRVWAAGIASIDVAPSSKARLLPANSTHHTLELVRGSVQATVDAAPRIFVIQTPIARIIDLGCEFIIDVDDDDTTCVYVRNGRVELECAGKTAIVPRGARCKACRIGGLGTPCF